MKEMVSHEFHHHQTYSSISFYRLFQLNTHASFPSSSTGAVA